MEAIRCQGAGGRCGRAATVAFVLLAETKTLRFARCGDHAGSMRTVLSSLVRAEQWSEATLHVQADRQSAR